MESINIKPATYNDLKHYANNKLEHNKPQIQSIVIKNANVVNVDRSDSNENQQEITLQDDNKNYYITIPDTTAVNENDKIDIEIKEQLIDKTLKKNDLSQSINQPKSKITIKHNQSTNKVPLITYLPDTFNQNGGSDQ